MNASKQHRDCCYYLERKLHLHPESESSHVFPTGYDHTLLVNSRFPHSLHCPTIFAQILYRIHRESEFVQLPRIQLTANYVGILYVPVVITNCSPDSIVKHLHPPLELCDLSANNQSNCEMTNECSQMLERSLT